MTTWWQEAIFYSIYPLGFCNAPERNDFTSAPVPRLEAVIDHLPYLEGMGFNALYLGPLFESAGHGYDTADYYRVDRRLGTEETVSRLVNECHQAGLRVILDGVFNHVGREFWAFRDLREKGQSSQYAEWFRGVDFRTDSPDHDGFSYEGWEGHFDLVTLNHDNPEVRRHLLDAVGWMIETLGIDGLRLDVAYMIDPGFQSELASFCKSKREDFFLVGEMIHGDYRDLTGPGLLDSATNYECYKGAYSSHNDRNYFEIAWSLRRQYGKDGLYRETPLLTFVDNHDVDRAASILADTNHLPLLYVLLFTMPGVPSVYYGSELGWRGVKRDGDAGLRPAWSSPLDEERTGSPIQEHIRRLIRLRRSLSPLAVGSYRELFVSNEQFCFERSDEGAGVVVALNCSDQPADIPLGATRDLHNLLDPDDALQASSFTLEGYGWKLYGASAGSAK